MNWPLLSTVEVTLARVTLLTNNALNVYKPNLKVKGS